MGLTDCVFNDILLFWTHFGKKRSEYYLRPIFELAYWTNSGHILQICPSLEFSLMAPLNVF